MSEPRMVVVRGGAIGDFILTLPVLAALRRSFGACRLEVVGYPHIVELARAGGLADAVRPIEARALAGFFARGGELDPDWRAFFAGAALVLAFLYDPDGIFEENVKRCGTKQYVAGPHRPDEAEGLHATRVFLRTLERLAVFDGDPVPRLQLSGATPQPGKRRVVMHPGSGSVSKNWPVTNWLELVESLLPRKELNLVVVGGESEGPLVDRMASCFGNKGLRVLRRLPLVELGRAMAGSTAFVGHDSGITHLAAALGVPGLVLWGPTRESVWAPLGPGMVLLRASDGLERLSVSTVREALLDLLSGAEHADARP